MMLVALGRSSHYRCSSLHAVVLAAWLHVEHRQIRAGLALGMMLVELGPSSHQCLSFARRMNIRNCYSDSADVISVEWHQ